MATPGDHSKSDPYHISRALDNMPKVDIIQQHADWLIVNKPAGITMHQDASMPNQATLGQCVMQQTGLAPLWPVHRLDKATSGLIIFAKNAQAAALFGELFSQHNVKKHYIALAQGKPKKKQGWIKGDMEKGRNGSWLLTRSPEQSRRDLFHLQRHRHLGTSQQSQALFVTAQDGEDPPAQGCFKKHRLRHLR